MPNLAVIQNGKVINIIVGDLSIAPPEGCSLELLPENAIWDGNDIVVYKETQVSQELLVSGGGAIDGN